MAESIVVTGMGIVTGLGCGKEATLDALLHGTSGVGTVKYLDTSHTDIPVSEVQMSEEEMRNRLGISSSEVVTRTPLLAMLAMREALQQAGVCADGTRKIVLINGTTVGGMEKSEQFYNRFFDGENAPYIEAHDCGAGTDKMAAYFGKFSLATTISTACSSAANAIILGAEMLETGEADVAVVGGTECLSKFHLNGFNTLMILDRKRCRPFDDTREGLNLGEGAAFLVLEREREAVERNAGICCRLEGYANACDAFHQTATSPDGEGAFLAMTRALKASGLQISDIDYVNAHGTGTGNNDSSEAAALLRVFGEKYPPVSSTKAYTGHCTSAAGSVEAVISVLAMQNGFIPANLGFETPMKDVNFVPQKNLETGCRLNHVMTNSFGFGGNDSSLIFGRYVSCNGSDAKVTERKRVFVSRASQISVQQPLSETWYENPKTGFSQYTRAIDPDYKPFINPMTARRMGKVLKRALTTSLSALNGLTGENLDAVIMGTGLGCIENTEKFLSAMVNDGEQFLTPTYFMQSTHNTIASQVALNLKCHGYNCTYSHRGISFESALQDAFLQFRIGKIRNALVGAHDEMTESYFKLLQVVDMWKDNFAGETAVEFLLENRKNEDALCEILDTELFFGLSADEFRDRITGVLQKSGLQTCDIDAVFVGDGEHCTDDGLCRHLQEMFQSPFVKYKRLFGEGFTMHGLGIYAAAHCLKRGSVPQFMTEGNRQCKDNIKYVLVLNNYKNIDYSITLLSKC